MNFKDLPIPKNNRHIEWTSGVVYLNFGKYAGETLEDAANSEPDYIRYLLTLSLPDLIKEYLEAALEQVDDEES